MAWQLGELWEQLAVAWQLCQSAGGADVQQLLLQVLACTHAGRCRREASNAHRRQGLSAVDAPGLGAHSAAVSARWVFREVSQSPCAKLVCLPRPCQVACWLAVVMAVLLYPSPGMTCHALIHGVHYNSRLSAGQAASAIAKFARQ